VALGMPEDIRQEQKKKSGVSRDNFSSLLFRMMSAQDI
jgi:hypothetical protein